MGTINSMVTKIIEEQAKTNKSVTEIQKEAQSTSLKIDETQKSLSNYSTSDQFYEFKQEIIHNVEEVKSQSD
jgi:predicted  nucleic acid-binding Zn-ribbon protein